MISETEMRINVAETAGDCGFCTAEISAQDVQKTVARDIDEEYYGIACPDCPAMYQHDRKQWYKPTPPGQDVPRIDV